MKAWHAIVAPITVGFLFVGASLPAGPLTGGPYSLLGATTAGGGTSQGGVYAVTGWAGSATVGISQGGDYELAGGWASDEVTALAGEVVLKVRLLGGQALLSWPAEATGFQLESTPALGPAVNWQAASPAPQGGAYTIPAAGAARFFRLRKP